MIITSAVAAITAGLAIVAKYVGDAFNWVVGKFATLSDPIKTIIEAAAALLVVFLAAHWGWSIATSLVKGAALVFVGAMLYKALSSSTLVQSIVAWIKSKLGITPPPAPPPAA